MRISQRLSEVLAWRAVAELVRRHPEFDDVEFFWRIPGAGPPGYYAARFRIDERWSYLGLHLHPHPDVVEPGLIHMAIETIASFHDVRSWAEYVEQRFDLNSPSNTPATTRQAVGFRLVAEVLGRRLAERPFTTAMPAEPGGDDWETWFPHPEYTTALRALQGMKAHGGYSNYLWEVLPVHEQRLGIPYLDEMEINQVAPDRIQTVESPEKAWEALVQVTRHMPASGVIIAPQVGKARRPDGEVVDLESLYNANGRSTSRTSSALFG